MNETNEQLMEQLQHGHVDALSIIYERLHEPLYCFLFRYTKDEQLSVDIVHDAFEMLQKKNQDFQREKGTVKSYLFQIGYRLLINKLNRRKRWQTLLPFLVPTEKSSCKRKKQSSFKPRFRIYPINNEPSFCSPITTIYRWTTLLKF